MASCSPNITVTATSFSTPQTLLNATGTSIGGTSGSDRACRIYVLRNRDATNYVRVAVKLNNGVWLCDGNDGGAGVGPGVQAPFADRFAKIVLVQVWTEGGTPIVDGYTASLA